MCLPIKFPSVHWILHAVCLQRNTSRHGAKALKVQVMHTAVVAHQQFALTMIQWLQRVIARSGGLNTLLQLKFRQSVCRTIWNDFIMLDKKRKFTLCHYVQRHLGQSENWIFCVSLVTRTCNVWSKRFPAYVGA